MSPRHLLTSLIAIVLPAVMAGVTIAQDYPSKPIRLYTGGAGGSSDQMTRLLAQRVLGPLGQPTIVDNRVTIFAAEATAKAPPDGYTLLVQGGAVWILPLFQQASWDPERDFATISLVSRDVLVLAVHPSVPAKSIKELIALARGRPGELNVSVGQAGATGRLAAEYFRTVAGLNMVSVPFNTGAQQMAALLSGETQMMVSDAGLLMPLAKAGRTRVLAVTSSRPSEMAPGLPTVADAGLPGYEWVGMTGTFAPARTPVAIINRLNQELVRYLRTPEAKEAFAKIGADVADSTPEQFAALVRTDRNKTSKMIQAGAVKTGQ